MKLPNWAWAFAAAGFYLLLLAVGAVGGLYLFLLAWSTVGPLLGF